VGLGDAYDWQGQPRIRSVDSLQGVLQSSGRGEDAAAPYLRPSEQLSKAKRDRPFHGLTRGALWSAEHPTAAGLAAARQTRRVNLFHPEFALPAADRAELADYARSGFDRGHMTPSGDMPDPVAQQQSFSLANIVPQAAKLNRGVWERIESAVRTLVNRRGEAYVVTGPAFQGANFQQIGGRVLVPSSTLKEIYVPATGDVGAWSCTNTATPACTVLSVADLAAQTGVDPFPGLSQSVKETLGRLPVPRSARNR